MLENTLRDVRFERCASLISATVGRLVWVSCISVSGFDLK